MTNAPAPERFPEMRSDWSRLGNFFSVRFSLGAAGLNAEWMPRKPTKQEFERNVDRYRGARDAFFAEVAQRTGRGVTCVEM